MRVGYLCTFTPKELIDAAGFTPVRILADSTPISLASAHIQSYACIQARGSLEKALRKIDVDAVVFTRSCDTLMRLADIWEIATKMKVYSFEFPTKIDSTSKNFLISEIAELAKKLEEWGGKITFDSLKESIELYKLLEVELAKIFDEKPDYELLFKVQQMKVKDALNELKSREQKKSKGGPKILVTGSVCPFLDVMKLFEDVGFSVKDDLCTGTRFFTFKYPEMELRSVEDCFRYLAEKYVSKAECPTKHYEKDRRFERVLELAKDCDGVVFLLLKFCDPHFFDYPQLKQKLEEIGKKVLLLELEFPVIEQLRTRIEAFYEVIMC
ncbi:MAG: 2-hydroxyacyl-CoA dehydratase [Archaeoglobaceae archaeon]|nr:2-hydroxyacyl-CoA dehydratase [Archaeoglobaceae archaeon]MCX8151711.1 2-hydroxyacyl-CoA dehydratase [Archaeoglobaceae archaeon]MDW8013840.1 2-hydroxyacyl-CoA dehydratase [Archaeoglobaceae archaeon]